MVFMANAAGSALLCSSHSCPNGKSIARHGMAHGTCVGCGGKRTIRFSAVSAPVPSATAAAASQSSLHCGGPGGGPRYWFWTPREVTNVALGPPALQPSHGKQGPGCFRHLGWTGGAVKRLNFPLLLLVPALCFEVRVATGCAPPGRPSLPGTFSAENLSESMCVPPRRRMGSLTDTPPLDTSQTQLRLLGDSGRKSWLKSSDVTYLARDSPGCFGDDLAATHYGFGRPYSHNDGTEDMIQNAMLLHTMYKQNMGLGRTSTGYVPRINPAPQLSYLQQVLATYAYSL
ncbi:hypothetical protein CPLU01_06962 [Colletotrichum plurivorum]|uniref:Uncharacterized protein n=1 Tax=Colletotrichum plurivorum TaxID=2175906 RepID=A0A8H6NF60_9PEZI|nr:hypothetical protein CPLU01_06962 [Colletotrichum plurivorum]